MKLPRDLGGEELCGLLGRFDYTIVRRTGSHIRLTLNTQGKEHHITIPRHTPLKTGTLNGILRPFSLPLLNEGHDALERSPTS